MRIGIILFVVALLFSPVQLVAKGKVSRSLKNRVYYALKGFHGNATIRWQKITFGAGVLVACLGVSCSNTIQRGTLPQGQLSQMDFVGQHVHAIVDGQSYLGYISQTASASEMIVTLYDGTELPVSSDEISGTIHQVHEDLGKSVLSPPTDEESMVAMHGLVTSVYSDGYYQVMVGAWIDSSGEINILDDRLSVIVHVDDLDFLEN